MFTKLVKSVKKIIINTICFVIGFFIAFIVLSLVFGFLGLLNGDGIVLEITSIIVLILSIAFGVFVVIMMPKENENNPNIVENTKENCEDTHLEREELKKYGKKHEDAEVQKTYKVAGVTHYTGNIMSFSQDNYEYTLTKKELVDVWCGYGKIWKYTFRSPNVELVPEPENKYDSNAIKVMAGGKHIGYIKSVSCSHLLKCIKEKRIIKIYCKIGGGPYKELIEDYDIDTGKQVFTINRGEISLYVHLNITELK